MSAFHFSASQIETFRLCPRKWAFQKIDKIFTPPHPAAELGSEAHTLRENWLLNATLPPVDSYVGKLAQVGLESLPAPGTCEVERKIDLETSAGICTGRIDFFILDQGRSGYSPKDRQWPSVDGVPLVGDHKTTGSKDWIKSESSLANGDAQATIYAKYAFTESPSDHVDLFWAYMIKSKPHPTSHAVRVRVERGHIEEKFSKIEDEAKELLTIFDTIDIMANDVEYDPKGCSAFGGCPYLGICKKGTPMKPTAPNPLLASLAKKNQPQIAVSETQASVSPPDALLLRRPKEVRGNKRKSRQKTV